MRSSAILALLAGTIATCAAQAQPAILPPHKIHSNDLIAIAIYGEPDLTRTVRVDSGGAIRLPLLDRKIKADGLMPEELEKSVAEAFRAAQILVDPFVTVTVTEYHALLPVSVAGAVRNPVTFEPVDRMTLLEAITRAGGLTSDAGPDILISLPGGAQPLVRRVPVHDLLDHADPAANLLLQGGEEIRVPEAGRVFVLGNVKVPGAFSLHDPADASVLKAIALTQGLAPYAANEAFIYRREGGAGSQNEIRVDLAAIMQRKAPDVSLAANDILYVPDRSGKRIAMTVLEKVAAFGAGVSSALVYVAH